MASNQPERWWKHQPAIPHVKPDDPKEGYLWLSARGLAIYSNQQWVLVSNGQPVST